MNNPYDSLYNLDLGYYLGEYITLVSRTNGGTIVDDVTLVIGRDILPDDAYIEITSPTPSGNPDISYANSMAGSIAIVPPPLGILNGAASKRSDQSKLLPPLSVTK